MKHFTKDQLHRARRADLHAYLLRHHGGRFTHESSSIHLKGNYSLSIGRGQAGYKDFATDETGNSVDFLVKYLGYRLDEAVFALCDSIAPETAGETPLVQLNQKKSVPASFPPPAKGPFRQLFAFLRGRGIPDGMIKALLDRGLVYQTAVHNNIVFVNYEHDWGEIRGTNTYSDMRCRNRTACLKYEASEYGWCAHMKECPKYGKDSFHGMVGGCRKDGFWWFSVGRSPSTAFVCESSIDAISLYLLHHMRKEGRKHEAAWYVSIGGVTKQPAIDRLKRQVRTVLAVDNDEAGRLCRSRNPELESIIPKHKDWNEDLMSLSFPETPQDI